MDGAAIPGIAAAADVLDPDLIADLIVAGRDRVTIYLARGDGTFAESQALTDLSGGFFDVALADLDGDGDRDAVLTAIDGQGLTVLRNTNGTFADTSTTALPQVLTGWSVAAFDVNGDTLNDIILGGAGDTRLLLNNGGGTFVEATAGRIPAGGGATRGLLPIDLNGDGGIDLIEVREGAPLRVLLNNRLGVFTDVTAAWLPNAAALDGSGGAVADMDGDGDNDAVIAAGADGVRWLRNEGGEFAVLASGGALPPLGPLANDTLYAIDIVLTDQDADGDVDVVIATAAQDILWRNDGATVTDITAGNADGRELLANTERSYALVALDGDADRDPDLVRVRLDAVPDYLENTLPIPRVSVAITPDFVEQFVEVTVDVDAFDEDGIASTLVTVTDPNGGTVTVNGTAPQFTFTPQLQGGHTVTVEVTDAALEPSTATITKTVAVNEADVANPVVSLTVTPDATPLVVGQSIAVDASATDNFGVTSFAVDLEITETNGTVTTVAVPLDSNGMATVVTNREGTYRFIATASDAKGNTASEEQSVIAGPDGVPPEITAVQVDPQTVDLTETVTFTATATDNVIVAAITATITKPSGGTETVDLDPVTGIGTFVPFEPGTHQVSVVATDGAGNESNAFPVSFEAEGIPDNEAPLLSLSVTPGNTAVGNSVTLTLVPSDNVGVTRIELSVNDTPIPVDAAGGAINYVAPVEGSYTARAEAFDGAGNSSGVQVATFEAIDPANDRTPPVVSFNSPDPNALVGAAVDVIGTVEDPTLASYELRLVPPGGSSSTVLATGVAPVTNDVLATLDPTLLKNGVYELQLEGVDAAGNVARADRKITVNGEYKPGVLVLEFEDIRVQVAGTPVEVVRTYDSRDRNEFDDFGFGWSLKVVSEAKYSNTEKPGEGWNITSGGPFGIYFCNASNDAFGKVTEVRLSEFEFYQFQPILDIDRNLGIGGGFCTGRIRFEQVGGIPGATLRIGSGPGAQTSFPLDWCSRFEGICWESVVDLGDPNRAWEPRNVRLTTRDGRSFDVDLQDGLRRIDDEFGNTMVINDNGVSVNGEDKLTFLRDVQGRVEEIVDPAGNSVKYRYNQAGDLVEFETRSEVTTGFEYDANHYLETIIDGFGNATSAIAYDDEGRLQSIADNDGNGETYAYDIDNNTEQLTDREGRVTTLEYDDLGNLIEANIDGETQMFRYDAQGNRIGVKDPNDGVEETVITYHDNGLPATETDPEGNVVNYNLDSQGRLAGLTRNGAGVAFDYYVGTNNDSLRSVTDDAGNVIQSVDYDDFGNVDAITTALGNYDLDFDADGNLPTRIETATGLVTEFTYNSIGVPTEVRRTRTTASGVVTDIFTHEYDADGKITSIETPDGGTITYTYNAGGKLGSITNARDKTTEFEYDTRGNLTVVKHPNGTEEIFGYNLEDLITSHTDQDSRTTFYEYDSQDNLSRIIFPEPDLVRDPSGLTPIEVRYEYDGTGALTAMVDANGNRVEYDIDRIGRRVAERRLGAPGSSDDIISRLTYATGERLPSTETDPLGIVAEYSYDTALFGMPRLVGVRDAVGTTEEAERSQTFSATAMSQLGSHTDENANTFTYGYDSSSQLNRVLDPEGGETSYGYDEAGNLISITDARGNTTTMTYDFGGRLLTRTLPDVFGDVTRTESFEYDGNGNLIRRTDFDGRQTTYAYDDVDRLIEENRPDGVRVTYAYTGTGQVQRMTDASGVTEYTYDNLDRMTRKRFAPTGTGEAYDIDYVYDAVGNRLSVTTPAGTTAYTYDAFHRVSTVTDVDGGVTTYTYDKRDNVTAVELPSGNTQTFEYDARKRPTQIELLDPGDNVLSRYTYTYDAVGNQLTAQERHFSSGSPVGRDLVYTYDRLNRLTGVDVTAGGATTSTTYVLDEVGNATSIVTDGVAEVASFDERNRLTNKGSLTYTYDARGNVETVSDGVDTVTYAWDAAGRLIRIDEAGGAVTSFTYNGRNIRASRTANGQTKFFVVDEAHPSGLVQLVVEMAGSTELANYTHGNDLLRAENGSGVSYPGTDAIGSTRALMNMLGSITDEYDYGPYGSEQFRTGSNMQPFQFTGEEAEAAGELYYLRARMYDPNSGRFLSMDPHPGDLYKPVSLNKYLYASANPINFIDPTGEFSLVSVSISVAIVGILVNLAYTKVYKPIKQVYDNVKTLLTDLPKLKLNEKAKREELVWQIGLLIDWNKIEIINVVKLGEGSVDKAYEIIGQLADGLGGFKWVMNIHAANAATWLRALPEFDGKPGHYLDCGFNQSLQGMYGLSLLTGLKSASFAAPAVKVIAVYLSYFTFVLLVAETADGFVGNQTQFQTGPCPTQITLP